MSTETCLQSTASAVCICSCSAESFIITCGLLSISVHSHLMTPNNSILKMLNMKYTEVS